MRKIRKEKEWEQDKLRGERNRGLENLRNGGRCDFMS